MVSEAAPYLPSRGRCCGCVRCQGLHPGPCPRGPRCQPRPLAPQVKALGCEGSSPPSVPSWLDSLGLQDYVHSFLSSGYSSIDSVRNLWELELVNVSAAAWACAARCPLPWAAACPLGAPWARAPPDYCTPPAPPGPKGSPARPPKAHHRLPRRQALRGAAPEAPEVFPAEGEWRRSGCVLCGASNWGNPWDPRDGDLG